MDGFQLLGDESINWILTDPPYECSTTRITKRDGKVWDSDFGEWDRFFTSWVGEAYRVLKPNSGMVVFVPATRFETLMSVCEEMGFKYVQPWFWEKTNPAPIVREGCLQWAVEHMLYVKKGSPKLHLKNNGLSHNIFRYPIPGKNVRIHDTQKPVELLIELLEIVSAKGETILDPFSGSGSTGIAAVNRNRFFIGFEKDEEHYRKSVRWFRGLRDLF
jgi:site-specific DNA-methyltransferase (adenine-specific)